MSNHPYQLCIARAIIPFLLTCASLGHSAEQPEAPKLKIQEMQQVAARNEQQLRSYQWIETTTLTIKGKSRPPKQSICRYAPDGTIQKTQLGQGEASSGRQGVMPRGLIRGIVVKEKKKEVNQEVEQTRALAKLYLPFNRGKFKEVLRSGKATIDRDGRNDEAVVIKDYAKPGDLVTLTLNSSTMQIKQISVKSYFDKPKDVLMADVQFSALDDGTTYPGVTTIKVPSKKLSIATVRSDFSRPVD